MEKEEQNKYVSELNLCENDVHLFVSGVHISAEKGRSEVASG